MTRTIVEVSFKASELYLAKLEFRKDEPFLVGIKDHLTSYSTFMLAKLLSSKSQSVVDAQQIHDAYELVGVSQSRIEQLLAHETVVMILPWEDNLVGSLLTILPRDGSSDALFHGIIQSEEEIVLA